MPSVIDFEAHAVEVRAVAHTHFLHDVVDALDRRENRVNRDGADGSPAAFHATRLNRNVSKAALNLYFDVEIRLLRGQMGKHSSGFMSSTLELSSCHLP